MVRAIIYAKTNRYINELRSMLDGSKPEPCFNYPETVVIDGTPVVSAVIVKLEKLNEYTSDTVVIQSEINLSAVIVKLEKLNEYTSDTVVIQSEINLSAVLLPN